MNNIGDKWVREIQDTLAAIPREARQEEVLEPRAGHRNAHHHANDEGN